MSRTILVSDCKFNNIVFVGRMNLSGFRNEFIRLDVFENSVNLYTIFFLGLTEIEKRKLERRFFSHLHHMLMNRTDVIGHVYITENSFLEARARSFP